MKISTWNVNSLRVRLPQVLDWLRSEQPDVLALQETKLVDEDFPVEEIRAAGYHVVYAGQKTYNGVAIISKAQGHDVVKDVPGLDDHQRRFIAATYGKVRVVNLYVPNGESIDSEKYAYKLDWLKKLTGWLKKQTAEHPHLAVVGDFNIAPESCDVYDPVAWEGQVLFSEQEREAFSRLLETGLCDTFRLFEQEDRQFSWWDYRMAAFRRNMGLRIDHILASDALCRQCKSCRIDKAVRKLERPSDHAPVVAEFDLP